MKFRQPEYDHLFHDGAKRCVIQSPYQQITISPSSKNPGFWDFERISFEGVEGLEKPIRQDALGYLLERFDAPADVAAWESIDAPEPDASPDCALTQRRNVVYFLKAGPFVKIGFTARSLDARIDQLKTGCPYEIQPLGTISGGHKTERELHRQFQRHRANLEWFHAADEIMSFIREHADAA